MLTAKDAQRLFALGRYFFTVAFHRWVKENQVEFTTDSASATLQDESSEAQNGPESDGTFLFKLTIMSVMRNKRRTPPRQGNAKRHARNVLKRRV